VATPSYPPPNIRLTGLGIAVDLRRVNPEVIRVYQANDTMEVVWPASADSRDTLNTETLTMTLKQEVVSELGDNELLAPDLIAKALVANDQVKYYFALLQTARDNADQPRVPAPDLKAERIASEIDDVWLDTVVAGTRKDNAGNYRIPRCADLLQRIEIGITTMLKCLPDVDRAPLVARHARLEPSGTDDYSISGDLIAAMTSGDRVAGDSLHLVVMDAHRAINHLQAATAVETVAGARVHRLSEQGRGRVAAFMDGVNRTAPLKFDHPGLGTTATEHNGRLLLQNDIGTTDAHVLVVRVRGLETAVTYTDVHEARLKFFKSLFETFEMRWEGTEQRHSARLSAGQYLLVTGRLVARDEDELARFLTHLGSRIVFLIDWNHMRRRLHAFVSKPRAIEVLKWAADHDYGHRALIEIGGERALAEAVEYAAGQPLRYGQRLDDLLSEEHACAFLKEAMRLASEGLRQRRSRRVIGDAIKADLRRYFENERIGIFDTAAAHVAFGYDIALSLCEGIERIGTASGQAWISQFAARALEWESKADALLNEAREDVKRFRRPHSLLQFFERADDGVDRLEEAASLLDLFILITPSTAAVTKLRELAEQPLKSAQELVKCVECAASVTQFDVRDDLDDFLAAFEKLIAIEHAADDVLRTFRRWLILENADQRQTMLLRELAQALENVTDAHAHAGQMLRTYLMDEVLA
jgi:uncharacterized protein Yka (UPF0111/DUF47 family)